MTSDFIFRWILGGALAILVVATIWVGTILPWENIFDMAMALMAACTIVGLPWLVGDLIVFKWRERMNVQAGHQRWCGYPDKTHSVCIPRS